MVLGQGLLRSYLCDFWAVRLHSFPLPRLLQRLYNNNCQEQCHFALLFTVRVATVPTL